MFIEDFFRDKQNGIYVDIGCFHPVKYSNTAKLFNKGWRGYNIDINKTSIDLFKIVRPKDKKIHAILSSNSKEKKNIILQDYLMPEIQFQKNTLHIVE